MSIALPLASGTWQGATYARQYVDLWAWLDHEICDSQLCTVIATHCPGLHPRRVRALVIGDNQRFAVRAKAVRWSLDELEHGQIQGAFFLGVDADDALVAVHLLSLPQAHWHDLRRPSQLLSDTDRQLLAVGAALAAWHARSRFCVRCGANTVIRFAGWQRHCEHCQNVEYPRIDPSVIVAIFDADQRLLLAHNTMWRPGYASLVAGFMEIGESPEQAVVRETYEEVGLQVDRVTYVASQPWPFPRSLMLGFAAQLADGCAPTPRVDGVEIDWARFYSRCEYRAAVAAGDVEMPNPISIARAMIDSWLAGSDLHQGGVESSSMPLVLGEATEVSSPDGPR